MTLFTPGIDFLARSALKLAIPPALFAGALRVLGAALHVELPGWPVGALAALSVPVVFAVKIAWKEVHDRRDAARMGARLAPRVPGKAFGNADVLKRMRYLWDTGYPADGIFEYFSELGPVMNMRVFWSDLIFTCSPEHIKLILATDFNNYVKGERFHETMGSVLGTGVFNSDGERWKFHRSMTRPFFTRDRISDFDLFDRHAQNVISQIKTRMRNGHAINFQDLMSRFTLDSATEFLFGTCVHSLDAGLPFPHNTPPAYVAPESRTQRAEHADRFARAFAEAQEVISSRERYGWIWPLTEMWRDRSEDAMRVVNAYIAPIIEEAIAKRKADPDRVQKTLDSHVEDGETLLDHLVSLTSDPVVLRDETLNIMIAGRDTTAATLTFVIYFLSMYPAVLARLRKEVLQKVGPARRPTYDDIREMKYLRAVINETLRLFPIVPFNTRETVNATVWPSADPMQKPIYVPAGTKVPYSVFVMHRRKDLWGPDAEVFDPDRFLDERLKKHLISNSFIFLPFNAGPRICLGQQFAYNEMSFMLIRLLQQFSSISLDVDAFPPETRPPREWAQAPGRKSIEKIWPKIHLTMYTHGGMWVRMREAESGNCM